MRTTVITIIEYASLYGCTSRNVSQKLNSGKKMPFIVDFKKSGGTWLLEVELDWYNSKSGSTWKHI